MKNMLIRFYGFYLNVLANLAPRKAAKAGFFLFCKPFRTPITQKQNGFFNAADKFTLKHDDSHVQGYRWGNGRKKILFLHGWQSHTYRWKPYVEALDKNEFSVYSIDAPGHGLSTGSFLSVPVYSRLIEKFVREYGPFHTVIGHSLGGFSLLYTLYKEPLLQIDQIILLAPPGEASDFISVFQNTLGLTSKTVGLVTEHFYQTYEVGPEYFSTTRFANSINVKGLIIHDEDDTEAPYRYSIPLHKTWERSRLITTKGFGHNLRSATVVKEVVDFVNATTAANSIEQQVSSRLEKL
jgi:pimeloyl-ACP methyl ester carboxylesterase